MPGIINVVIVLVNSYQVKGRVEKILTELERRVLPVGSQEASLFKLLVDMYMSVSFW